MQTETTVNPFAVGDKVHWSVGSDVSPGTVIKVTQSRVWVRRDQAELKTPGACTPGGFAAHWHEQPTWYPINDENGEVICFTYRKRYDAYGMAGASYARFPILRPGWAHHRDMNF